MVLVGSQQQPGRRLLGGARLSTVQSSGIFGAGSWQGATLQSKPTGMACKISTPCRVEQPGFWEPLRPLWVLRSLLKGNPLRLSAGSFNMLGQIVF